MLQYNVVKEVLNKIDAEKLYKNFSDNLIGSFTSRVTYGKDFFVIHRVMMKVFDYE